jgi:hypothetical protein
MDLPGDGISVGLGCHPSIISHGNHSGTPTAIVEAEIVITKKLKYHQRTIIRASKYAMKLYTFECSKETRIPANPQDIIGGGENSGQDQP